MILNFCWNLANISLVIVKIASWIRMFSVLKSGRDVQLYKISFTYSQNKMVHRCDVRWVGRSCWGPASTNPTIRARFNENISRNTSVSSELIIPSFEGINARRWSSVLPLKIYFNYCILWIWFMKPQNTLHFFCLVQCLHLLLSWHHKKIKAGLPTHTKQNFIK